ncbi:MAG: MBL fold metallo-hydrolase [Clostridia bacterium]|nr:MBL fold metallo-hydrolase [Clostridia bacterium]
MKLTAFKYGVTEITENMAFQNGNKKTTIPISLLFFLIEYQEKKILVDVGCDTMPGFKLFEFQKPVEVLETYGVDRGDITDVIITHSHHDHIEAIGYYENATVHIQKDEYVAATKYIPKNFDVHLIDDEFSLAENLIIKKIGGHSVGSCIVLADNYVLCGDECYSEKCLTDKICTGSSYNIEASEKFIEEFSKNKYIPLLFHDIKILKGRLGYSIIKN